MATSTSDYSVRDYGAVGDGTTNDTAAIQSTIQAAGPGGTVYFPAGTYLVSGSISPLGDQMLLGAGRRIAFLKSASGLNGGAVYISADNVQVIELGFIGANAASNPGVAVTGAKDALIERCWFDKALNWSVLCTGNSQRAVISRNIVQGALGSGIQINDSHGCLVTHNVISAVDNGIEIYQSTGRPIRNTRVIGNYIANARGAGVTTVGDADTIISGNTITGCRNQGIVMRRGEIDSTILSQYGILSSNALLSNGVQGGQSAIDITNGSRGWSVLGNIADSNGNCGIVCGAETTTIEGNTCVQNGRHGIYLDSVAIGCTVSSNLCLDNSTLGVGIGDGIRVESKGCSITANRCTDTRSPKMQSRGILLISSTSGHTITGNALAGNTYSGLLDMGTGNAKTANIT